MIRRASIPLVLAACLILIPACKSGPSSSGSTAAKDEAARLERKVGFIEGLLARRGQASQALEALTAALAGRVWLTDVTYDTAKIRVKGLAATNNLLADYIARLGQNPAFTNMTLGGSVMKNVRGRETQEFALEIALLSAEPQAAPAADMPPRRIEELEKMLAARQDTGAMLREAQGLARDSGLQMTKFAAGTEVPTEFGVGIPATVEVSGPIRAIAGFLEGLAGFPGLWVVERLFLRTAAPDDPHSPVRAAVTVRAYFGR